MTRNDSGYKPLEYKVIVLPDEVEEKTAGGIYLPEVAKEREQNAAIEGLLVDVSPSAFSFDEQAPKPSVGQKVMFAKFAGMTFKGTDGKQYRLLNDKDIVGARHG